MANKYPAELSGGWSNACGGTRFGHGSRAVFFRRPTAGLDPQAAAEFDTLLLELQAMLHFTVVLVTHDLDTLWTVTDRVAFLSEEGFNECTSFRACAIGAP